MLHHPKRDIRRHIGDATGSTKHYLLSAPGLTLNASRSNYQFIGNTEDRIKDQYGGQDKEHHCKDATRKISSMGESSKQITIFFSN